MLTLLKFYAMHEYSNFNILAMVTVFKLITIPMVTHEALLCHCDNSRCYTLGCTVAHYHVLLVAFNVIFSSCTFKFIANHAIWLIKQGAKHIASHSTLWSMELSIAGPWFPYKNYTVCVGNGASSDVWKWMYCIAVYLGNNS